MPRCSLKWPHFLVPALVLCSVMYAEARVSALAFSDDELPEIKLREPWIDRARSRALPGGLAVRTDLSAEDTNRLVETVRQTRSGLDEFLGAPPPRGLERPYLLLFAKADELELTMRAECVVPQFRSHGPARIFANDSGQWLMISNEGSDAVSLHRDLRAAAAEQYLVARFGTRLPPWLHEGLVAYVATLHQSGSQLVVGEPPSDFVACLRALDAAGDWLPPSQLAALDRDEWPGDREPDSLQMQAQAWAVLHFLLHGPPGLGSDRIQGLITDSLGGGVQLFELEASPDSVRGAATAYAAHLRGLKVGPVTRLRELGERLRLALGQAEAHGLRITEVSALRSLLTPAIPGSVELRLKPTRSTRSPRALRALELAEPPLSVLLEESDAGRVRIGWQALPPTHETQARWVPVLDW